MNKLHGRKTYLVVILAIIINGASAIDLISIKELEAVNTILGFLGVGTLRHGIHKNPR